MMPGSGIKEWEGETGKGQSVKQVMIHHYVELVPICTRDPLKNGVLQPHVVPLSYKGNIFMPTPVPHWLVDAHESINYQTFLACPTYVD